ncbi:hypothetical protein H8N01_20600 [Streptomyces sp. AC536]|uniref:hypothetical protein n=1 Tax=Streptomyces buecherae TaxID=2763006 RepID=UPI00164EB1EF|nr:hypothetical protein [Streptomyces buecherae]MBC3984903.1 hypothetical protein [Streptomyces buecherae]QNJ38892.1 hypothetical protein H7H31_02390 [Streptomyces buecherae]
MRQKLFTGRPGIFGVLLAPGVALLLTGCGSDGTDKSAPEQPSAARTSASTAARSPGPSTTPTQSPTSSPPPRPTGESLPSEPATSASDFVEEAFGAARVGALQSGLRFIDPALGAPEDLAKADAQCVDLQRNVDKPDEVAARRFSTGNHKVTEADGKRINTLLRHIYCGR